MDLADVKDLIKSLVTAAGGSCSLQQLLIDFEEETGFELPHFNFYNPKYFLLTLTDIVKVFKAKSGERVKVVKRTRPPPPPFRRIRGKTQVRKYGCLDLSTRNTNYENEVQRYDINCFIKAYQTGWVIVNDEGTWERVSTKYGVKVEDEKETEPIEFLFRFDDIDEINNVLARRATIQAFLRRIDLVREPAKIGETRIINYPLAYNSTSDEVKNYLKHFMTFQREPISCNQLNALYFKFYNLTFDHKEFGFRTLLEMVKSLKEVFRCLRTRRNEWLLYDASKAADDDEEEMYDLAFYNFPKDVRNLIINLLESHCEITSEPGIPEDDFMPLFYKKYRVKLDFAKCGFPDFKTMLSRLNGKILKVDYFGDAAIIKPLIERSRLGNRTVFSLTPADDLYTELFPIDSIGFKMKYYEMKLPCYFKLGAKVKIIISSVSSPHKFYVRLKKFEKEFNRLMARMHWFYKFQENKYRMPEATIRPHQICIVFQKSARKQWQRAVITDVVDKRHVMVHLVDSGLDVKVDHEKIRFLHRDFYSLPKQAFLVRIHNIRPAVGRKWPRHVNSYFTEIISATDALFRAMRYDHRAKRLLGELIISHNNSQISISRKLVRELLAIQMDDGEALASSDEESSSEDDNHERRIVPVNRIILPQRAITEASSSGIESVEMGIPGAFNRNLQRFISDLLHEAWSDMHDARARARNHARNQALNQAWGRELRAGWTLEKEISAAAFDLLNSTQWLQDLSQNDIENGLMIARNLAEKIVLFH